LIRQIHEQATLPVDHWRFTKADARLKLERLYPS
jgi:hypothetical protein